MAVTVVGDDGIERRRAAATRRRRRVGVCVVTCAVGAGRHVTVVALLLLAMDVGAHVTQFAVSQAVDVCSNTLIHRGYRPVTSHMYSIMMG